MTAVPRSLERLVGELARLPGVGQKTAQRLAFSILRNDAARARELARAIEEVKEKVRFCARCSGYAEGELCAICSDPGRDGSVMCVVEQPDDIYVIERSGVYKGLYHVLMGTISPLDGVGPDQLRIRELMARLDEQPVAELIVATNPSMQGEATALHLQPRPGGQGGAHHPPGPRHARGRQPGVHRRRHPQPGLLRAPGVRDVGRATRHVRAVSQLRCIMPEPMRTIETPVAY